MNDYLWNWVTHTFPWRLSPSSFSILDNKSKITDVFSEICEILRWQLRCFSRRFEVPLLEKTALGVHDFGEDAGAANVVKLGGNFLIAAAIQSLSEVGGCLENPLDEDCD